MDGSGCVLIGVVGCVFVGFGVMCILLGLLLNIGMKLLLELLNILLVLSGM